MTRSVAPLAHRSALATRLSRLVELDPADVAVLTEAGSAQRHYSARREIMAEGQPIREQRALVSGWGYRQRIVSEGRRQILSFVVPGDLIGVYPQSQPLAAAALLAITELSICPAPTATPGSRLAEAYARSAALDERYLLAQVTRLGRYSAYERLADWLLETYYRLALAGLVVGDRFRLPLTQELIADALGLTSVHVNRTLRAMRHDGLIDLHVGTAFLLDRTRLAKLVDYEPPRVSEDE